MNGKNWSLLLAVAALLGGCAKKPPPAPPAEPAPPRVEAPPRDERPRVDEEALRRQRIQARIAETFRPIYFKYDESALSEEGKSICQGIGALMKEVQEITARIEGHADERGTNEYNLALGERRARSVQDYLVSYGIPSGRFSVLSYGEERPAAEGSGESSWAQNRRAEFTASF